MLTLYSHQWHALDDFVEDVQMNLLPEQSLHLDWEMNRVGTPVRFSLGLTPTALLLYAATPGTPLLSTTSSSGAFEEGLWNYDVFELFIAPEAEPGYQEFNLAANGAWWTAVFNAPREKNLNYVPPRSIEIRKGLNTDGCWAALSFPISSLGIKGVQDLSLRGHAASITGANPRRYCSSLLNAVDTEALPCKPDFHQPKLWQSLQQKAFITEISK